MLQTFRIAPLVVKSLRLAVNIEKAELPLCSFSGNDWRPLLIASHISF